MLESLLSRKLIHCKLNKSTILSEFAKVSARRHHANQAIQRCRDNLTFQATYPTELQGDLDIQHGQHLPIAT